MLERYTHDTLLELRLARPPANALDPNLIAALAAAVEGAAPAGARGIVLSGTPGMFTAGLDVPALLALDRPGIAQFWRKFFGLMRSIAAAPVPVVAAVTGHSPAGGTVLMIFADYRIVADGPWQIGLNEVAVGLPVPPVISLAYARLVGAARAEQLLARAELTDPHRALALGLVDRVTDAELVLSEARDYAQRLAAQPPGALRETRMACRRELYRAFDEIDETFIARMTDVWFSDETQAAMAGLIARLRRR